jgi:hypothetical protein
MQEKGEKEEKEEKAREGHPTQANLSSPLVCIRITP